MVPPVITKMMFFMKIKFIYRLCKKEMPNCFIFSIWRLVPLSYQAQNSTRETIDAGHHHFFEIIPGLLPDVISMERYTAFMFIICSKFKIYQILIKWYSFIYLWRHNYVIMNFAQAIVRQFHNQLVSVSVRFGWISRLLFG